MEWLILAAVSALTFVAGVFLGVRRRVDRTTAIADPFISEVIAALEDPAVDWLQTQNYIQARDLGLQIRTYLAQPSMQVPDVRVPIGDSRRFKQAVRAAQRNILQRKSGAMPSAEEIRKALN